MAVTVKRFVPRNGELYWYVFWFRGSEPRVNASRWMGDSLDCMRLRAGNVFHTKEEAVRSKKEIFNACKV